MIIYAITVLQSLDSYANSISHSFTCEWNFESFKNMVKYKIYMQTLNNNLHAWMKYSTGKLNSYINIPVHTYMSIVNFKSFKNINK